MAKLMDEGAVIDGSTMPVPCNAAMVVDPTSGQLVEPITPTQVNAVQDKPATLGLVPLVLVTATSAAGLQALSVAWAIPATSPPPGSTDAAAKLAMVTVMADTIVVNVPCTSRQVSPGDTNSVAKGLMGVMVTKFPAVCVTCAFTVNCNVFVGGKLMICTPASKLATLNVAGQTAEGGPPEAIQLTLSF